MIAGPVVDFYFGPGSRYSYLAATRLPTLAAETGAVFRWRPAFSGDLIAGTGRDPFAPDQALGPYDPAYRALDVARWARLYGVALENFDQGGIDWRWIARTCVAAELLGAAAPFGWAMLQAVHARGAPPRSDDDVGALAEEAGLDPADLLACARSGRAADRQSEIVAQARAVGAFGVPTFIAPDGAMFWGQDRLPLLRAHLA